MQLKCYHSEHINDKQSSLFADMKKMLVIWIEDQTSHNIPLSQGLIKSNALTLFNSVKAERGEEGAEGKSKCSWFLMRKRICIHNIKLQDEGANPASNYPKDLTKIINESGYT